MKLEFKEEAYQQTARKCEQYCQKAREQMATLEDLYQWTSSVHSLVRKILRTPEASDLHAPMLQYKKSLDLYMMNSWKYNLIKVHNFVMRNKDKEGFWVYDEKPIEEIEGTISYASQLHAHTLTDQGLYQWGQLLLGMLYQVDHSPEQEKFFVVVNAFCKAHLIE
jgi:hypothetical protein